MPQQPITAPYGFINAGFNILVGFVFLSLGIGMLRGRSSVFDYFALQGSKHILTDTVTKLRDENRKMEDEITKIKQSKNYAQRVLKDKYHVTEEGENIIFFAD